MTTFLFEPFKAEFETAFQWETWSLRKHICRSLYWSLVYREKPVTLKCSGIRLVFFKLYIAVYFLYFLLYSHVMPHTSSPAADSIGGSCAGSGHHFPRRNCCDREACQANKHPANYPSSFFLLPTTDRCDWSSMCDKFIHRCEGHDGHDEGHDRTMTAHGVVSLYISFYLQVGCRNIYLIAGSFSFSFWEYISN